MLPTQQPKPIKMDSLSEDSKRALVNLSLEGIIPSSVLLADMQLLDSGKISQKEFLERAVTRAKS